MHHKHGAHTSYTVTTQRDSEVRMSYVTRATAPHTHSQPGIECCHSKAISVNLSLTYPVTTVCRSLLIEDRPIRLSQEYLCLTQLRKPFAHAHRHAWPLDVYIHSWLTRRLRIIFLMYTPMHIKMAGPAQHANVFNTPKNPCTRALPTRHVVQRVTPHPHASALPNDTFRLPLGLQPRKLEP
jgi:hypothetical protein